MCLSLEIFMPVLRENVSLKKNETKTNGSISYQPQRCNFFLPYTEQLIEITVIKRLFGNINIII